MGGPILKGISAIQGRRQSCESTAYQVLMTALFRVFNGQPFNPAPVEDELDKTSSGKNIYP